MNSQTCQPREQIGLPPLLHTQDGCVYDEDMSDEVRAVLSEFTTSRVGLDGRDVWIVAELLGDEK